MRPAHDYRAIRQAYDAVAGGYARLLPDMAAETPLDRAVLAAFVEMVGEHEGALVADVGCGTGRVTRHLHDLGLRTVGLDLSPRMVAIAGASHGELLFGAAHAAALPLRTGSLDGLVCWYSLIHLPASDLPRVFREFARVSRPSAPVLIAFQCGEGQRVDRTTSYGRPVSLTYYRHRVADMRTSLEAAGFAAYATVSRTAVLEFESTPQAVLLAGRND